MYGDKSLPERIAAKAKGKTRINVEYYITEEQFYALRNAGKSMPNIVVLTGFPYGYKTLNQYIANFHGWDIGGKKNKREYVYTVDLDFFKSWTRASAWVYGWLVTDGYVAKRQVRLNLKSHDEDVLHKIKESMKFTGSIGHHTRPDGRKFSILRICREELCEDIYSLGLARENKTFNTAFPPSLPDSLFWDFLRGVFEGDGNIRHRTGNTDALEVSICGATEVFILKLRSELELRGVNTRLSKNKSGFCVITSRSNADALRFCASIYKGTDESQRLNRKYEVYRNYVATYYDNIKRRSKECNALVEEARKELTKW